MRRYAATLFTPLTKLGCIIALSAAARAPSRVHLLSHSETFSLAGSRGVDDILRSNKRSGGDEASLEGPLARHILQTGPQIGSQELVSQKFEDVCPDVPAGAEAWNCSIGERVISRDKAVRS
jgi:hypothetical protein